MAEDGYAPMVWWMWLWGPLMLALWAVAIAAVLWLVVGGGRPRGPSGTTRARQILAERFARGETSADEYRDRLDQLR
jgi:putative membrane protein